MYKRRGEGWYMLFRTWSNLSIISTVDILMEWSAKAFGNGSQIHFESVRGSSRRVSGCVPDPDP
jgi:hypothetical protein